MVKTLVFVPCYNCAPQLERLLPRLAELKEDIFFIENCSTDDTAVILRQDASTNPRHHTVCHQENYGLGGSFKTAVEIAAANNCEWLIWFHGDDQATVEDLESLITLCHNANVDAIFGARFHPHSKRFNYSLSRTLGNKFLNIFASAILGRRIYELGSGLNAYRVSSLMQANIEQWPNHIAFDMNLLFHFVPTDRFDVTPIHWYEKDQVSNARNVSVALDVIKMLIRWFFTRRLIFDPTNLQRRKYETFT